VTGTASKWTLQAAGAINDKGQIIGDGIAPDGHVDSLLLTPASEPAPVPPPVPEPSTLAVFALTAAVVTLRRAKRWCSRYPVQAIPVPGHVGRSDGATKGEGRKVSDQPWV
jgi:hypothetical protein